MDCGQRGVCLALDTQASRCCWSLSHGLGVDTGSPDGRWSHQPSPAQGCEAETQAGSWKSRHGRAAGLLGLKHGCEKRIWRDSPASVGQVELVSAGLSRGMS